MAKKNLKVSTRTAEALRRGQVQRIKEEIVGCIERIQYPNIYAHPSIESRNLSPAELEQSINRAKLYKEYDYTATLDITAELETINELVQALNTVLAYNDYKITPPPRQDDN